MKKLSDLQNSIMQVYITLAKELRSFPTRSDLHGVGISRDKIRQAFVSLENLKTIAANEHPELMDVIIDKIFISQEYIDAFETSLKQYNRFVITTAVGGGVVDTKFLKSIKSYCKKNKAELLVLMCEDPSSNNKFILPEGLETGQIVFADVSLNDNVMVNTIKLSAKFIDPVTGLSRLGKRTGSFIYASPKQRLKFTPTANQKLPHALMTTGAITLPNYDTKHYLSARTAKIAEHDHVVGAIIVEIQDNEIFHFRQIQAEKDTGYFVDLGVYYKGNKTTKIRPKVTLGDWHSGETDELAKRASFELIELVKPTSIFIGDGFNGKSINHHEKSRKVTRAISMRNRTLTLADELLVFAGDLAYLKERTDEVVIVKSNHDMFLDEILEDGRFIHDPMNYGICAKLASAMIDGHNPLQYAVEELFKLSKDKLKWLNLDEDYIFAGIQLGAHGHRGPNGTRGSLSNLEESYGKCVVGHSHVPGILRGAYQVGTLSHLRVGYNHGASSWFHTNCLIYPNGSRQLINIIDGSWRL